MTYKNLVEIYLSSISAIIQSYDLNSELIDYPEANSNCTCDDCYWFDEKSSRCKVPPYFMGIRIRDCWSYLPKESNNG